MRNSSGCLTAFVSAFSRIMLIMIWIARPVAWNAAFSTFIIPCLGFLFLPFTTLMWLFLSPTISGLDWLWIFIAVICDVANWGAAGYANRNYLPGGQTVDTPTSPYTPPPASMSAAPTPMPTPAPTPSSTPTTPPPAASEKPQEPPQ
jgi:hypothetical protein